MANRSTAPGRIALMSLVVAGAVAGMASTASAQLYYYGDGYDPYPAYGYGYRYDYGYAPRPPATVPRAPAAVSPYAVNGIAARRYGLVRIERSIRRDDIYIVDGVSPNGQRQRLILDAYAGELIRRIPLRGQAAPTPNVARADPREEHALPRQRLVPQPPERPAEFKGPAEASAPATTMTPSPAAPESAKPVEKPPAEASAPATTSPPSPAAPPAPEPVKPAETGPAEASAPAAIVPPQPAKPAEPSPGATNPETGADKPRLVNPSDIRNTEGTERKPPLATAPPGAEASSMPPVQNIDPAPSTPKPETPIAPVAPMN